MKGFFSPIDKLAAELPRTKGTGAEFMTELSKRPGYKPQEAQDRDLQTLMALPKMAREEFLAKLKSKPAQELQDTVLSNEGLKPGGASNHMPKYEEHTLPGGKNYREILMRLPKSQRPAKDPASGHWDQPGVLAHVRVKDRTGPNGEKLLHIEEIQSDWHQKGRDQGYETPDMRQKVEEARLQHKLLKQQLEQAKIESDSATHSLNRKEPLFQQPDVQARYEAARVQANNDIMDLMPKVMKAEVAKQAAERTHNQAIPNAPFKKNWHELALKKMIHHAAEKGYHGIVITPGQEQADRYKMTNYVNEISHYPRVHAGTGEKSKAVRIDMKNGNPVQIGLNNSGIVENVNNAEYKNLHGKHLAEIVGKDLAQNILSNEQGKISGEGLQVGGEGMKGFYDKIVPSFLNQFGKKYGAQVGKVQVPVNQGMHEPLPEGGWKTTAPDTKTLHHFPITPEMREDVTKNGVPLYADGGSIKRYARGGPVLEDQANNSSFDTQGYQPPYIPAPETNNVGADIGLLNYSNLNTPATAIDSSTTSGLNALQPTTGLSTDYASVNPLNVSNNVAQNNIVNPDTLSANDLSSGYQFANSQGGIGLDQYYQNINNYLANNPSAQQLAQDKTAFGVSDADIARAQSLFPSTQTGGLPADTQPVTQPITQTTTQQPFGATDLVSQVTAWKPSTEYSYNPNNQFAGTNITLGDGQVVPYNAVVAQILSRYDQDLKNPALAVKSGLQLGISDDILSTLPGVDSAALQAGHQLIDSGAFTKTAINEATSPGAMYGQERAPIGSAMYNARIAAGLDAYGLPPAQVQALKATGKYKEPIFYDPAQFQQLASSNGTTPAQITQTGLTALYNAGYNSDEAAQLFNKTYGTNYTSEDYKRELNNAGLQKVDNPQLAVFGDSISAAMGFNQNEKGDPYADTSKGQNLAQYLGSNLKVYSANNSLGGSTTQDSLQGTPISFNGQQLPLKYGNFADYITQHKPETAVLRFGAADAIKLNDPDTTLKNIENMVNISNQNGTKPVLVGVTPFAKMGDFNAGNINSGITDSMIASADKINEGIKALAEKYKVPFVDIRQVPVPQGGLVDGVHPSGEYGNAMAQYIADQIKSANVLPSKQNQFASNGATQHMKTGGRVKPVGYTKEKFTVSPSLDQMMYELISVKHSKKVK